jgi:hypothetical protein
MEQPDLNELHTKFAAHEVQCEERWKTIFARLERMDAKMDRLQNMLLGATGTVILFLGGIIITLLNG